MATVAYIKYKPGGNASASAMRAVINYCLQPYKTETEENVYCTSGQDCTPSFAYKEFMATKTAFGKTDGVFFYHYVQSFSPEEKVIPEEANAIGLELARAWSGHEVLVATHVDRAHIHNHFIINSVNTENGLKLRQHPNSLKELRDMSDKICREHGLSVLEPYEKTKVYGIKTGEYHTATRRDSWKFRLIAAINSAMDTSWTKAEFIENMARQGYDVAWSDDRMHITYTCLCEPKFKDGSYRKCRDNKLHGEKYLKEKMELEFYERQKLHAEIIGRTVSTDERTDTEHIYGRTDSGYDSERRMGSSYKKSRQSWENEQGDTREDGRAEIFDSGNGQERNRSQHEERTQGATEGNVGADGQHDEGSQRTGWESSRGSLSQNRSTGESGRSHVVDKAHCVRNDFPHGSNSLLPLGILSAFDIMGDDDETEEEKRQREARNSGTAIGVVAGLVIGAVQAMSNDTQTHDKQDNSDDSQGFDIKM